MMTSSSPTVPTLAFGHRVRDLRTAMNIDQTTLGRLVGLAAHGIEHLENGAFQNPSLLTVQRIAQVLRTTVAYLTDGAMARLEDSDPTLRPSGSAF